MTSLMPAILDHGDMNGEATASNGIAWPRNNGDSNGVNGNGMGNGDDSRAVSEDGSSGIEDGLRELHNPTGERTMEEGEKGVRLEGLVTGLVIIYVWIEPICRKWMQTIYKHKIH